MIEVGINASRNRAGGAKVHLLGILNHGNPLDYGIRKVHIWSYKALLDSLPNEPWLVKHNPRALEQSLIHQLIWEYFVLPREAAKSNCNMMLNTDAGSVCDFHPSIVMSRDMLSFESKEMNRFGFTISYLRLLALRSVQARSLRCADGVIFLTHYAADTIQKVIGNIRDFAIIPHGVENSFRKSILPLSKKTDKEYEVRCVYVSNALPYKHQWNVVKAINQLRQLRYNVSLLLVGGGTGVAQKMLEEEMRRSDPKGSFVTQLGFLNHRDLPIILSKADIFIFASSCENMPNTLVEAMSMGLPIACSNCGPMPEVLQDGGVYFDPENSESIAKAVEQIINDENVRKVIAMRAKDLSLQFSWEKCAHETWSYINQVVKKGEVH
jgi:glycosyltransferase involved in cell wall biosynthesis